MLKFILTVKQHRHLGPIIAPYLVQSSGNNAYYKLYDKLSTQKLSRTDYVLNEIEQKIVKITDYYSDEHIVKRFSKKKLSAMEFFDRMDEDLFIKLIRPYIDSYIKKLFTEIRTEIIPIYYADERNTNLYPGDLLNYNNSTEIAYNFNRTEKGINYWLDLVSGHSTIKLLDKNPEFLCNDPAIFILGNNIIFLKNTNSKKLIPFLTKEYISIPKSFEKDYFKTFIKKTLRENRVNAIGFEIETLNIIPKCVLSINQDYNNQLSLILYFDYNNQRILANEQKKLLVSFDEVKIRYTLVNRNPDFENNQISILKTLGISNETGALYNITYTCKDDSARKYELINWLKQNEASLVKSNFHLVQEQQSPKFFIGDISFNLELSQMEGDWFDLLGNVRFGDFRIPFKALKSNILNKIREFTLPDGSIAIIPEEWFVQYENLFMFSATAKEGLRLKKHHYKLIEELPEIEAQNIDLQFDKGQIETIGIPNKVQASLRPYQKTGYQWLSYLANQNFGGCLADDMGLGKTLQTICILSEFHDQEILVEHLPSSSNPAPQLDLFDSPKQKKSLQESYSPPSLIIMPTSLVHNWYNEIRKFAPHLKTGIHSGQHRSHHARSFDKFDIILSSYGVIRNDIDLLKDYTFRFIILDESQFIKNPSSKNYKALMKLKSQNRIALTGTPIENSVKDLWSQMNFLNPGLLGDLKFYTKQFVSPIEKNNDNQAAIKLKKLVLPFLLRRTKEEVAKDLPTLSRQVMICDMSEKQYSLYEQEKSKARNHILHSIKQQGIEKSSIIILRALMRLRQIANHPLLIDDQLDHESGKFELVKTHLEEIIAEKHKVLIFSSFVKHLELFESFLKKSDTPYQILTGTSINRQNIVNDFQQNDIPVFLISLKAGGVGLNLTAADYVFILDPWWNPAVEEQAINRAHRIGQNKNVFVYRFISKDTIEEKIIALQEKKSQLADAFVNSANPFKSFSTKQIEELFS
ncbi:MAG: DEAD/DEAH box helicase [Bacteroidales bacterium]|nr:DEAD/DEAH box helicase [Bacteroidales bacterium]